MEMETQKRNIHKETTLVALAEEYAKIMEFDDFDANDQSHIVHVAKYCIHHLDEKENGLRLMHMAAEQGNSSAQFSLGNIYYEGTCDLVDFEKAVYWFGLSADQGDVGGINNLGHCYLAGVGCEQDIKRGFELINLAANRNSMEAFEEMGHCYYHGIYVEKDLEAAQRWWEKAAIRGNLIALDKLQEYFPTKVLGIVPFEILKNAFNSLNFEQFISILKEDCVYTSAWIKEAIQVKENIEKHLQKVSLGFRTENAITQAELAIIKKNSHGEFNELHSQVGQYCIVMRSIYNHAIVLLEGVNYQVSKIQLIPNDKIEYKLVENKEVLSREEIHEFGINIVIEYMMEEGYQILSRNIRPETFPQIKAEKDGIRYLVIVETEVAPFTGRLKECEKDQIIQIANEYDAVACFASVSIGSAEKECFKRAIALPDEGFYVNFQGLEIIGDFNTLN